MIKNKTNVPNGDSNAVNEETSFFFLLARRPKKMDSNQAGCSSNTKRQDMGSDMCQ